MTTHQAILFFMFAGMSPSIFLVMYGGNKLDHYPDSRKYLAIVWLGRLLLAIPVCYAIWRDYSDLGPFAIIAFFPLWPIGVESLCRDFLGFSFVEAWNLKDVPYSLWDFPYLIVGFFVMGFAGLLGEDRGDRKD